MTRSVSGKHANLDDYVDLLKRQMEEGGEDGGPDLELCDRVAASGLDLPSYISHCNAHLLEAGTTHPAVASVYLDVNRFVKLLTSLTWSSLVHLKLTSNLFLLSLPYSLYAASGT